MPGVMSGRRLLELKTFFIEEAFNFIEKSNQPNLIQKPEKTEPIRRDPDPPDCLTSNGTQ